jgi:amino acid adenylation domain-containing protein
MAMQVRQLDTVILKNQDIFWKEWALNPQSTAYNISLAYEIKGELDQAKLERAIDALINSHQVLRIVYVEQGEALRVIVQEPMGSHVECIDLSDQSQSVAQRQQVQLVQQLRQWPFDLTRGPLFKIRLLKRANNHYCLALCFHHSIVDGLSERYILDCIQAHYNDQPLVVDGSLGPYLASKRLLSKTVHESMAQQVWQQQVARMSVGGNDLGAIKADRSEQPVDDGSYVYFTIPADVANELKKWTVVKKTSLFSAMMSVYATVLHRLTQEKQLTICYAVNTRPVTGERVLGCFTNILPMSVDFSENMALLQLLEQVTAIRQQQKKHQNYPFSAIVAALRKSKVQDIDRYLSLGLMQTHVKTTALQLNGLQVDSLLETANEPIYDLCLEYELVDDVVQCRLNYRRAAIDPAVAMQFPAHFRVVLQQLLHKYKQSIHQFYILSSQEQRQMLVNWNQTQRDYALDRDITAVIDEHAATSPNKPAFLLGQSVMTYRELSESIQRIASHLSSHRVAKGDWLVPVILPVGIERPLALLAILRAGGCYVPIDPDYPEAIIAAILQDCQAKTVVTNRLCQAKVDCAANQAVTTVLFEDWKQLPATTAVLPPVKTDGLAYVMYTSGSTGKPKGVEITHRALLNFLYAMQDELLFSAADCFVNITPYTFDISGLEIYLPLLVGARCVIADERCANNGESLAQLIDQHEVSFVQTTPTKWQLLLDTGLKTKTKPNVLCGGEAFPVRLVGGLLAFGQQVWNVYGPTEATIWSSCYLLSKQQASHQCDSVPVGHPIANTEFYVLDDQLQPLPIGCVGDLYIGGQSLARGYCRQNQLTSKQFIAKPKHLRFTKTKSSERLYKTGDQAKWLPGGQLCCLGRRDFQIKHHGHRIELAEIETALMTHPAVKQAVVVQIVDSVGQSTGMAAYYTLQDQAVAQSDNVLRLHLLELLPTHSIPGQFKQLDRFPMASSGKVDRQALAQLKIDEQQAKSTALLQAQPELQRIWSECLNGKHVNADSDFFALGGDSLAAMRIAHQVEKQFLVRCNVKDVLKHSQLPVFSSWLESQPDAQPLTLSFPVDTQQYPLTYAQKQFWLLSKIAPAGSYNYLLGWKLTKNVRINHLTEAINWVRKQQALLRTRYVRQGNEVHQQVVDYQPLEITVENISELAKIRILNEERNHAFDLDTEIPFRVRIILIDSSYYLLLINMHHIVFDAHSIAVLTQQLTDNYQRLAGGLRVEAQPTSQYLSYVDWERRFEESKEAQIANTFWQNQLTGYQPLSVPGDKDDVSNNSCEIERYQFVIPSEQMNDLSAYAHQNKATVFLSVLTSLYVLLAKYTQQDDLVVHIPVGLRDLDQFQSVMGPFVSTLPLRIQLAAETTCAHVLSQVKEVLLSAFQYKHVPADQIQAPSRLPVLLSWRGDGEVQPLKLPWVTVEELLLPNTAAKADLNFVFTEKEGALTCDIEYLCARYSKQFIESMADSFIEGMRVLLQVPETAVSRINCLSESQRIKVIDVWNRTEKQFPLNDSIPQLVDQQANKSPDRVAVSCHDEQITYAVLKKTSDALSAAISARFTDSMVGSSTQPVIGVYLSRGIQLLQVLLAVMKSGAAYLPLSLDLPPERLSYMLKKAQCGWVITDQPEIFADLGVQVLPVDDQLLTASLDQSSVGKVIAPDSIAYVIYTSGSTGFPKAVAVNHRSAVNCIQSIYSKLNLSQVAHKVLSVTDYSFDVSVVDFFMPLIFGGELIVLDDVARRDPEEIVEKIVQNPGSILQATPSLLEQLMRLVDSKDCRLKVISAGEALTPNLADKLLACGEVYNIYGPTETTVYATLSVVRSHESITIGKPIDNVTCYIVDPNMNPVPVGVLGELCVAGAGVSLGYLHDVELTEKSFIDNPFGPGKLYKTGDLAIWNGDGEIVYRGRRDNQVKIRGQRVELAEIESRLLASADVSSAVVLLKEEGVNSHLLSFVVLERQLSDAGPHLKRYLSHFLPAHMIPRHIVLCEKFPLTPSGKVDRSQLLRQYEESLIPASTDALKLDNGQVVNQLVDMFVGVLGSDIESVQENIFELGINSLSLVQIQVEIENKFGIHLKITDFFKFPTISQLAGYILGMQNIPEVPRGSMKPEGSAEIAIIGYSGEFPGAKNIDEFWQNLVDNKETITHFTDDELRAWGEDVSLLAQSNYVTSRGVLINDSYFDANFFRVSPHEATLTDPQHRLMLEHAWSALEVAGYASDKYAGVVGVYAGSDDSGYAPDILRQTSSCIGEADAFQTFIANSRSFLSTKISYKLNLTGPSLNIHTACSTGLVVVTTACQQLLAGQCDMALAGSVSIKQPQYAGYYHQTEGISSSDGHCRAFSADADGTVPSAGVGVVVLKRLDRAMADGDTIHAVIKGAHINNDGAHKAGYSAPSIRQQAACVEAAMKQAGVRADSIQFVEMHGTGTKIGDPIEVEALNQVFAPTANKKQYCAIGSVKSNIGHADAAAGMAGLFKVMGALKHGLIPASLHCETTNPAIDFANSAFFVNTTNREWDGRAAPRRAGVNSLGLGGTNAFVVLEEAPKPVALTNDLVADCYVFPFSAKTATALSAMLANFCDYVKQHVFVDVIAERDFLRNVAYTLQVGRSEFAYRAAVVAKSRDELIEKLVELMDFDCTEKSREHDLVYFFPGQGAQYAGMGSDLYQSEPVFQAAIDRCAATLDDLLGIDLKALLFPELSPSSKQQLDISNTRYTQPALFCIEYALVELWHAWGVEPDVLLGQSLGEYVAAVYAGIFSLDDALQVIAYRAKLVSELESGNMLAIALPVETVRPHLPNTVSIATISSPRLCIVSGQEADIYALQSHLVQAGVATERQARLLNTSHAFHSRMMEKAVPEFVRFLQTIRMSQPRIPIISNLTGRTSTDTDMATPLYWANHLVSTVRLSDGIRHALTEFNAPVFMTVGPGRELQVLVDAHVSADQAITCVHNMQSASQHKHKQRDQGVIYQAAADLWVQRSLGPAWERMQGCHAARRIPLPTYPFERQRYWPQRQQSVAAVKSINLAEQPAKLYEPSWTRLGHAAVGEVANEMACYVFFVNDQYVAQALRQRFAQPIIIQPGEEFTCISPTEYVLRPGEEADYIALLKQLPRNSKQALAVTSLWSVAHDEETQYVLSYGLNHLLFLAKALLLQAGQRP